MAWTCSSGHDFEYRVRNLQQNSSAAAAVKQLLSLDFWTICGLELVSVTPAYIDVELIICIPDPAFSRFCIFQVLHFPILHFPPLQKYAMLTLVIKAMHSTFTSSSSGSCHDSDVTWQENGRTYGSVCSSPRHGWQIVVPPYGCGLPLWSIWCFCRILCPRWLNNWPASW